jgi:hypothetical protein
MIVWVGIIWVTGLETLVYALHADRETSKHVQTNDSTRVPLL